MSTEQNEQFLETWYEYYLEKGYSEDQAEYLAKEKFNEMAQ